MDFYKILLISLTLLGTLAHSCSAQPVEEAVEIQGDNSALIVANGEIEGSKLVEQQSARARFKLPRLFDFAQFKATFKRTYTSFMEELTRQRLFLARSFRAFVSAIKYKYKRQSYYLSVNDMSDRTPDELEQTHLHFERAEREQMEAAEEAEIEDLELEDELVRDDKKHHDSLVDKQSDIAFDDLNRVSEKVNYVSLIKRPKSDLPDEVFVDHSKTGCMLAPRRQGNCGSCYIFPVITLYEWFHCNTTGQLLSFSEQYPLDCGLARFNMKGCGGGSSKMVIEFSQKYGLALRREYPYTAKHGSCPYANETSELQMGRLRADYIRKAIYKRESFDKLLRVSPIVVYLKVQDRFHEYGGGVDDGEGCKENRGHAVLLVGSGREDGVEYWLMRNSYGVKYGEAGYYKIDKASNCTATSGLGYTLKAVKNENDRYVVDNEQHLAADYGKKMIDAFEMSMSKLGPKKKEKNSS